MFINEVSQQTELTKKAIEYYTLHGLINPTILDNGYRVYSNDDIKQLNKIYVLRKLNMSIDEIQSILTDNSDTLQTLLIKKEFKLQQEIIKKNMFEKLSLGISYEQIKIELKSLDKNQTITEKLLDAFPGFYGRFICLHFAQFLNQPILTQTQQLAFETIVTFLDSLPSFDLPKELKEYLYQNTHSINQTQIKKIIEDTQQYIENPNEYLIAHQEAITNYLNYKQSENYQNSIAFQLLNYFQKFNTVNGYNDIFIPAMKQLSDSYAAYHQQLEIANEKFLLLYPKVKN